ALGYPAVTQGPDRIQGYVLRFDDASVLEELDELEQYEPGRPEHSFYVRYWLTVATAAGPIEAWVYLMSEETIRSQGGIYLPSGDWDIHRSERSPSQP
ncbi:MAG: gamma-glutamylcyclotransferase, partial [Candidatus Sericytochromatia bacterium]